MTKCAPRLAPTKTPTKIAPRQSVSHYEIKTEFNTQTDNSFLQPKLLVGGIRSVSSQMGPPHWLPQSSILFNGRSTLSNTFAGLNHPPPLHRCSIDSRSVHCTHTKIIPNFSHRFWHRVAVSNCWLFSSFVNTSIPTPNLTSYLIFQHREKQDRNERYAKNQEMDIEFASNIFWRVFLPYMVSFSFSKYLWYFLSNHYLKKSIIVYTLAVQ